jgi:polysaccharide deacetylase family protein (PEP-CTERM system associated)
MINVISVDVEDWFHPTEVQAGYGPEQWEALPSRVESATERTLALLERHSVRGTFFVLGWVAERFPGLVRRIAAAGHEIACHSYWHQLVYEIGPERFRSDTQRAVAAIAGACGCPPRAYRAPSYSITSQSMWALQILVELGFTHDSSIYPVAHDRYGIPGFPREARSLDTPSGPIVEVPVATARLSSSRVAPVGGGGYLRMLPYAYVAAGIRRLNHVDGIPACIYFHPWEIDPEPPRPTMAGIARLRTYMGLGGMERKLERLLGEFEFSALGEVFPAAGARDVHFK